MFCRRPSRPLSQAQELQFEDSVAINDLYFIHDRKMNLLNTAVWALIKLEDLVLRLLHESIGGDLVNAALPDWERRELRREKVLKGLKNKHAAGVLSDDELKAISIAVVGLFPSGNGCLKSTCTDFFFG